MSFVLDNSISMRWLFGDGSDADRAYADRIVDELDATQAWVPATWGLEVANVIARSEAKSILRESRSSSFFERLRGLTIEVDQSTFEHAFTDILNVARKYGLTAYDASYLELAIRLELPLATLDARLRKAAERAGVEAFLASA